MIRIIYKKVSNYGEGQLRPGGSSEIIIESENENPEIAVRQFEEAKEKLVDNKKRR